MRKLGAIGLVLVGLLVSVQALNFANQAVLVVCTSDRPTGGRTLIQAGLLLLSAATALAFGILLVRNHRRLSDKLFDASEADSIADAVSLLKVGLILIGIWLVATGIPNTLWSIGALMSNYRGLAPQPEALGVIWEIITVGVVPRFVEFGIGVGLIAYSDRLAKWLFPAREPD